MSDETIHAIVTERGDSWFVMAVRSSEAEAREVIRYHGMDDARVIGLAEYIEPGSIIEKEADDE